MNKNRRGRPIVATRIDPNDRAAVDDLVAAGRFPDRSALVRHAISDLLSQEPTAA